MSHICRKEIKTLQCTFDENCIRMKNKDFARKIKELRVRRAMSQEELSEKTGLSLRTIQRIETGETIQRGDSLKRISLALEVSIDELTDWGEELDTGFLALFNLSSLSFLFFPLLGIIVPFSLWVYKKDKVKSLQEVGKRVINFQLTFCFSVFFLKSNCFFMAKKNLLSTFILRL